MKMEYEASQDCERYQLDIDEALFSFSSQYTNLKNTKEVLWDIRDQEGSGQW